MAIFSTHILNSVNGTHFSDIDSNYLVMQLIKILIFHKKTDMVDA